MKLTYMVMQVHKTLVNYTNPLSKLQLYQITLTNKVIVIGSFTVYVICIF